MLVNLRLFLMSDEIVFLSNHQLKDKKKKKKDLFTKDLTLMSKRGVTSGWLGVEVGGGGGGVGGLFVGWLLNVLATG